MDAPFAHWTRRRFLSVVAGLATTLLAACARQSPSPAEPLAQETLPATEAAVSTASSSSAQSKPVVAIARCEDYGTAKVEAVVRDLVEQCGGLGEIIKPGGTVVIKPNFTAGGRNPTRDGLPNIMTYTTHPDVTRAVALLAKEAGAGRVILTEGWGDDIWAGNRYDGMISELGLETLNLDEPAPAADYAKVAVPDPYELRTILLNEVIAKADVLISIPKIKCHASAGVTISIKNIFGCTPLPAYRERPNETSRTLMHQGNWGERLPRILVDILSARPINFAVVDGISTIDQGEGPWNQGARGINIRTVRPNLLMAGRNPVAVDAVGTAVMGFDPTAKPRTLPFPSGLNHIALAAAKGLGTNRLEEIEVRGLSIDQARFPFTSCPDLAEDVGRRMYVAMGHPRPENAGNQT